MKNKELKRKNYKLSYYVIVSPTINNGKNVLLFSARTAASLVINKELLDCIVKGDVKLIDKSTLQELIKRKFIVPQEEVELLSVVKTFKEEENKKKGLSFTVQPSANCQLGCGYCGQSHENYNLPQRLNDDIVELFESKLMHGQYKHVNVGWFGGEPLIGLKQMEILSKRFIKITNSKNIGYNLQKVLIREGDIFLVHINVKEMIKFKEEMKVLLLSDIKMSQEELTGKNHVIVEGIVSQQSALIGKTLTFMSFIKS